MTLLYGSLQNLFFPPQPEEYTYFARASEKPYAAGDTLVQAAWAADAAMLCYARYGCQPMSEDEFAANLGRGGLTLTARIGDWSAHGTQGYFAAGDGFAVLAFRGTEIDDPADLDTDLDVPLVHEPNYNGALVPAHPEEGFLERLLGTPCLVHRGFQSALNLVWTEVHRLVAAYRLQEPDAPICVAGHSLGGALALLAYARFSDQNMAAYTIGCPRAGNAGFVKHVAGNPGKGHFRFVNCSDTVTHVPPDFAFYRHAPDSCYQFDESGCPHEGKEQEPSLDLAEFCLTLKNLPSQFQENRAVLAVTPAPPELVDHSMARYCMRLWDCV